MRDVETYLSRAEEALRLFDLAEGREAKAAILEIVRTWIRTAERRVDRHGLNDPEFARTFDALNRTIEQAGASLSD